MAILGPNPWANPMTRGIPTPVASTPAPVVRPSLNALAMRPALPWFTTNPWLRRPSLPTPGRTIPTGTAVTSRSQLPPELLMQTGHYDPEGEKKRVQEIMARMPTQVPSGIAANTASTLWRLMNA